MMAGQDSRRRLRPDFGLARALAFLPGGKKKSATRH